MPGSSTARGPARGLEEYPRVGLGEQGLTGLLDDGVVIIDASQRIHTVNPAAERLLGYSQAQLRGHSVHGYLEVIDEASGRLVTDPVTRCIASGEVVPFGNHDLLVTRGGEIPVAGLASPVRSSHGSVIGVALTLRDATPTRLLMRQLAPRGVLEDRSLVVDASGLADRVGRALEGGGDGARHALLFVLLRTGGDVPFRLDTEWREILEDTLREQDCLAPLGRGGMMIFLEDCSRAQAEWIARRLAQRFNARVNPGEGANLETGVEIEVYTMGAGQARGQGHRYRCSRDSRGPRPPLKTQNPGATGMAGRACDRSG